MYSDAACRYKPTSVLYVHNVHVSTRCHCCYLMVAGVGCSCFGTQFIILAVWFGTVSGTGLSFIEQVPFEYLEFQ